MKKDEKIVLKKTLDVTELSGEKVITDYETGKYYLIKGVGNDIWDMLGGETTPDGIIGRLLAEYDVTSEECEASVMAFLEKMREYGFI